MISDLKPGQKVTAFFILRHKERRMKKGSSESYLSFELGDASGRIFGSFWNAAEIDEHEFITGGIVKIRATVIEWHGQAYLNIDQIRPAGESDQVSTESLLPKAARPVEQLLAEFETHVDAVSDVHLKTLLTHLVQDKEIRQLLKQAPGGKLWHHCYMGGLLEHTLSVVKIVRAVAQNYAQVNADLLITGALLHDIGKLFEYQCDGYIEYSDEGRLHGHIALGYHLIAARLDAQPDFPVDLRRRLLHLILAHQGQKEQGSPVVPMTREAFILYYADELDSKLGAFDRICEQEHEKGKRWSNYVNLLDRFFYFGDETPPK
jgi:3'-5' exoribonuclease